MRVFHHLKTQNKLFILISLAVLAFCSLVVLSIFSLNKVTTDKSNLYTAYNDTLNADRDMYQALVAYKNLLGISKDSSDYSFWLDEFQVM